MASFEFRKCGTAVAAATMLMAGCVASHPRIPATNAPASLRASGTCTQVTIAALGADPRRYEGRGVCVSGFFGRIVPYGETNFQLFATKQQAERQQADLFLDLGIRWDVRLQAQLSHHSAQFAQVEGIFEHDQQCWSRAGQGEPAYNCYPPHPMRARYVLLRFADGTIYRHPEFDARVASRPAVIP